MSTKFAIMRSRSLVFAKLKVFVLVMLLSITNSDVFSQAASYNLSYATNVTAYPGSLNTETDATTTGWTLIAGTTGAISADVWSSTVSIPFAFDFSDHQ
ncbi:MAG: hypothetical protein IPK08_04355 [Bacteroidetes bacterium]|nr:hypothetical protein [Bacteroidota bacterium]